MLSAHAYLRKLNGENAGKGTTRRGPRIDDGGQLLATLASFTATCQQFGLNPWAWLRDTLIRLPVTPADQLDQFLPGPPAK